MSQLDRLLAAMVGQGADGLRLVVGDHVQILSAGVGRPLTRQPLTPTQIVALVREIAPPEVLADLDAGRPVTFRYENGDGTFVATTHAADGNGGGWWAELNVEKNGRDPQADGAKPAAAAKPSAAAGNAPTATTRATGSDSGPGIDPAHLRSLDALLRTLYERGGSDLHLRCGEPPLIRKDGDLVRIEGEEVLDNERLEGMIGSIIPDRNLAEYRESNDTDFAYEIPGTARYRANALRDRHGAAAVFRVIPATIMTADELGLSAPVQALSQLKRGLVLVTGPTGSGKSTTLCGLIDLVNRTRNEHIITIEDPIEFVHPSKRCLITQRQVGVHTSSFKSALRAALREDPDIILVGELRDLETVAIAIETAETGHLVFGTLHTSTAASTIDRIIDQFSADRQDQIRVMLSESLKGVISQTLCRKVGGGRAPAREVLLSIPALANLIREGKTFQIPSVMQTSRRFGMITLNDALLELVDAGTVEPAEAHSRSADKSAFVAALKTRGHDVSFAEIEAGTPAAGTPAAKSGSVRVVAR